MTDSKPTAPTARPIAVALQGGGSHGAFTWGVLDRLLEEPDLPIEGASGTSAGAMNAAVLATGLARGGRQGARDALAAFWRTIGRMPGLASLAALFPRLGSEPEWSLDTSPVYVMFDLVGRMLSPYDLTLHDFHPLRDVVEAHVDFAALRSHDANRLSICATHVPTGRPRFFDNTDLSVDAVLASTCLPFLFRAVQVDGEPYWDGGYTNNPGIFPIYRRVNTADVVLVSVNPLRRDGTPTRARDIINRVNEISFNTALMVELRAIYYVQSLIDAGAIAPGKVRPIRLHAIDAEPALRTLGASSKLNNDQAFLTHLFGLGRAAAEDWLGGAGQQVGLSGTMDVPAAYLGMDRLNEGLAMTAGSIMPG
jgi:NTE family protein